MKISTIFIFALVCCMISSLWAAKDDPCDSNDQCKDKGKCCAKNAKKDGKANCEPYQGSGQFCFSNYTESNEPYNSGCPCEKDLVCVNLGGDYATCYDPSDGDD